MYSHAHQRVGMYSLELGDHRRCLLQYTLDIAQIITSKLVGIDTYRFGHVSRHRSIVPVAFDESVARCMLEGAGDVHENLLAFFDIEIFDCINSFFHLGLTLNRRAEKNRAHQASVTQELGRKNFRFKPSVKLELAFDASPFIRPDQALMGITDGVQGSVQAGLPEIQEPVHLGKIGSQIIVLPDIRLQHGLEIGDAVEDVCSGETIAIQFVRMISSRLSSSILRPLGRPGLRSTSDITVPPARNSLIRRNAVARLTSSSAAGSAISPAATLRERRNRNPRMPRLVDTPHPKALRQPPQGMDQSCRNTVDCVDD